MTHTLRLKKGLDIKMFGEVPDMRPVEVRTGEIGLVPDDFPGYTWKPVVKVGDPVSKGGALMFAKENPVIKIVSPLSGVCSEIRRGERRKILAVVVKASENQSSTARIESEPGSEGLIRNLCESGLWALMRQRPFDIIPDPDVRPRDIFITAFDSSPLSLNIMDPSESECLERGIKALSTLTDGKVYLGVEYGSGISSPTAVVTEFIGPHPSGNVGVQIAAVKPVNKGDTVWALDASVVIKIGKFISERYFDANVRVAVTGEGLVSPVLVTTVMGTSLSDILKNNIKSGEGEMRVISGNVLTGYKEDPSTGFLRYPYRQITVIPEGADADEFMGWASLNPKKYSVKHSFPAFIRGLNKPFRFDSRIKGGHRAMIVSGEYDKVFPMDIYPEFLLKAIMAKDIDKMEKLGIYEVAPEDFALAEFVDTSKLPLQQIVKDGLDYLRKEL